MECTGWIGGSVRPVRVGMYERRPVMHNGRVGTEPKGWSWWDGEAWSTAWISQRSCVEHAGMHANRSNYQPSVDGGLDFEWRGLAADPSAK